MIRSQEEAELSIQTFVDVIGPWHNSDDINYKLISNFMVVLVLDA